MKVILNKCFGGFDVSDAAYELYAKKKGIALYWYVQNENGCYFSRDDKSGRVLKYCFTEDFGDNPKRDDIDWDKMLYLNSEKREDKVLIEVVEELGDVASGSFGELVVVEIPDDMNYVIDDYDGIETLHARVEVW